MAVGLRERNRLATMGEVRRVAFTLMDAEGFDAVTVEQIAAQSSVSPSTVYRYFGTKEALVLSAERPGQLVDRLGRDDSTRSALDAFRKAATKVWASDDSALVELGLIIANGALAHAWERQLLDQRGAVAAIFASRRGSTTPGVRDRAVSSAALGVLISTLPDWQQRGGGKKTLDKLLSKGHAAVAEAL